MEKNKLVQNKENFLVSNRDQLIAEDVSFKYFNSEVVAEFIINKTFGNNKRYFWEKYL